MMNLKHVSATTLLLSLTLIVGPGAADRAEAVGGGGGGGWWCPPSFDCRGWYGNGMFQMSTTSADWDDPITLTANPAACFCYYRPYCSSTRSCGSKCYKSHNIYINGIDLVTFGLWTAVEATNLSGPFSLNIYANDMYLPGVDPSYDWTCGQLKKIPFRYEAKDQYGRGTCAYVRYLDLNTGNQTPIAYTNETINFVPTSYSGCDPTAGAYELSGLIPDFEVSDINQPLSHIEILDPLNVILATGPLTFTDTPSGLVWGASLAVPVSLGASDLRYRLSVARYNTAGAIVGACENMVTFHPITYTVLPSTMPTDPTVVIGDSCAGGNVKVTVYGGTTGGASSILEISFDGGATFAPLGVLTPSGVLYAPVPSGTTDIMVRAQSESGSTAGCLSPGSTFTSAVTGFDPLITTPTLNLPYTCPAVPTTITWTAAAGFTYQFRYTINSTTYPAFNDPDGTFTTTFGAGTVSPGDTIFWQARTKDLATGCWSRFGPMQPQEVVTAIPPQPSAVSLDYFPTGSTLGTSWTYITPFSADPNMTFSVVFYNNTSCTAPAYSAPISVTLGSGCIDNSGGARTDLSCGLPPANRIGSVAPGTNWCVSVTAVLAAGCQSAATQQGGTT